MRITGAKCAGCGKETVEEGNWAAVWRKLKSVGWTADRGIYRCPACSEAWRARLDEEAKRSNA